jgi:Ca2+-binding EF-hand superfamily protein
MEMTIRELRVALTAVENQNMTVAEMRKMLFNLDNQDATVQIGDFVTLLKEQA